MKAFLKGLLKVVGVVAGLFIAMMVIGIGGGFFLVQAPFLLALGWPAFLMKILPHVAGNPVLVGEGVLLVVALGIGTHFFLVWFYGNYGASDEGQPPRQRWRLKWSLSGLAIFLLMFVTSIAVTGFVHQTAWLVTSTEPLTENSWSGMNTKSKMRGVGVALSECLARQGGVPKQAEPVELKSVVFPNNCATPPVYKDGWGSPFLYTSNGTSYVLKSYGRNRIPGGGAGDFDDWIFSDGKFIFPITAGDTSP